MWTGYRKERIPLPCAILRLIDECGTTICLSFLRRWQAIIKDFDMWRVTQVMNKKVAGYTVYNDETGEYKNCDIDSERTAQDFADFLNGEEGNGNSA